MPETTTYQAAFFNAHFKDDEATAHKMIVPFGLTSSQRLSVYKNNLFISLSEALAATFTVTKKLVGENFFNYTAREFIKTAPPKQGPIFEYGEDFSEFLKRFEPASSLPYLADVANLEWQINLAYHAENITPINAADLKHISDSGINNLRFIAHPACRIIESAYPLFDIWHYNQDGAEEKIINIDNSSKTLIIRPDDQVHLIPLNDDVSSFVLALINNNTIDEAYQTVVELNEKFDAVSVLIEMLAAGVFSSVIEDTPFPLNHINSF